ncbi:MAG: helix-turn-helix domain-containing protein [Clostridia bacterium]|nr:helix-turn-helix domain-containing protein [Clostridia bacterium]
MSKKYDRQIQLLNLLLRCERVTIDNISSELGVCVHTVKRDIADLQYHFPIFTYAGKGGGVELNACFSFNRYILDTKNVMLIKYSLEFLAKSDDVKSSAACSLLYKLFHKDYGGAGKLISPNVNE